jgi:hypothetical protein
MNYAKGDFSNAQIELEKVREKISPGLWHFNMGTLKAKMSIPAEARFHFLEARLHGFTEKQLNQNLELVETQLNIISLEKPLEVADYAMKAGMWSQNGFFTMLSLLILVIGMITLKKERKYSVLFITIILTLIPFGLHFWVKSWDKYITLTALEVREGPSVIFGLRGELPDGVLVITRKSGEWREIIYPSRFRGWIKNAGLKELE